MADVTPAIPIPRNVDLASIQSLANAVKQRLAKVDTAAETALTRANASNQTNITALSASVSSLSRQVAALATQVSRQSRRPPPTYILIEQTEDDNGCFWAP